MPRDLHELSRLNDSLSYLYVDKAIIERDLNSIVLIRAGSRIPVPISALTVLMLGPGTNITHAAMRIITESGCMVIWCGEGAMNFYGYGMGETRSSERLLRQAEYLMDDEKHMQVVRRMFSLRFPDIDLSDKTLEQIRGMEGVRVRESYKLLAKRHGIKWRSRDYNRNDWDDADDLNRALSTANACLYALCNAAIVSLGYSPGLGFIHTGKMLSFTYDIADLYKLETSMTAAFEVASSPRTDDISRSVRVRLRELLRERRVMKRIAADIDDIFQLSGEADLNRDDAGELWDEGGATIAGGINRADDI